MRPILLWKARLGTEDLLTGTRIFAGAAACWLILLILEIASQVWLKTSVLQNPRHKSLGIGFLLLVLPAVVFAIALDLNSRLLRVVAVRWYRSAPRNASWWRLLPIRLLAGLSLILASMIVSGLAVGDSRPIYLDWVVGIVFGIAIALIQDGLLFENPMLKRMARAKFSANSTRLEKKRPTNRLTPRQRFAMSGFLALAPLTIFGALGAMMVSAGIRRFGVDVMLIYWAALIGGCAAAWIMWRDVGPVAPAVWKFFFEEFTKITLLALVAFVVMAYAETWLICAAAFASGIWISSVPRGKA